MDIYIFYIISKLYYIIEIHKGTTREQRFLKKGRINLKVSSSVLSFYFKSTKATKIIGGAARTKKK